MDIRLPPRMRTAHPTAQCDVRARPVRGALVEWRRCLATAFYNSFVAHISKGRGVFIESVRNFSGLRTHSSKAQIDAFINMRQRHSRELGI